MHRLARLTLLVALATAPLAAVAADSATALLKTSRVKECRLVEVTSEGGKPTAILERMSAVEGGAAVALDPRPVIHAHVGDEFSDGRLLEIRLDSKSVLVRENLSDPRLLRPYRDIVLEVMSAPPLQVKPRRRGDAMFLAGRTWPSCRVQLLRGDEVLGETSADVDGRFEFPFDEGGGKVRVVVTGSIGRTEWKSAD